MHTHSIIVISKFILKYANRIKITRTKLLAKQREKIFGTINT